MRRREAGRVARIATPLLALVLALVVWEVWSRSEAMRTILVPPPSRVVLAFWEDAPSLLSALVVTVQLTAVALFWAVLGGVGLALLMARSRLAAATLQPFAVVLQVTPLIATAPLIVVYADSAYAAALICAWLIAFFPILSNTFLGLRSADHRLRDLFRLYGASGWQRLWLLQAPTALPYFLGGLRISAGLAMIGAVTGEFIAGAGGQGLGLASRILETSYRLQYARMFAALVLIMVAGVLIYAAVRFVSHLALRRWHDSEAMRD